MKLRCLIDMLKRKFWTNVDSRKMLVLDKILHKNGNVGQKWKTDAGFLKCEKSALNIRCLIDILITLIV